MYESFFKFRDRPFPASPVTSRYLAIGAVEEARKILTRGVGRSEGPGLLIGPAGAGKSLVLRLLADQFRDEFVVALLAAGRLANRRDLLQSILFELGLPYRGLEEGELRLALIGHLESESAQRGLLLLVDEAHTLQPRLLDEIRMLCNVVKSDRPRVHVVLAGTGQLEERFAAPLLESLQQQIGNRFYLRSLTGDETFTYVRGQVAAVGGDAVSIFPEEAIVAIHRLTEGVPRLINQVCDHALVMASAGGRQELDAADIEEAWADLQQLPAPALAEPAEPADVVEFGSLDGQEEEPFDDPTLRLDQIERQVAAVQNDEDVSEPQTPLRAAISPSPRKSPDGLDADPFGDSFEEEEVILDRYATLDGELLARRVRVTCREGREMAALLAESPPAPGTALVESDGHIDVQPVSPDEWVETDWSEFLPCLDAPAQRPGGEDWPNDVIAGGFPEEFSHDVIAPSVELDLPEAVYPPDEPVFQLPAESGSSVAAQSFKRLPQDDSDLIVVEEPEQDGPSGRELAAKRGRYRNLFAQLRKS